MSYRTIDFARFSSIKIGPKVPVYLLRKDEVPPPHHLPIGHANNLLLSPTPPPLLMLDRTFDRIDYHQKTLRIAAATPTGKILSFCKRENIGGFEFVAKLPGTLGGMVAMNAGVKRHETFNHLLWVRTTQGIFSKEQIEYGYRFAKLPGVILEAAFTVHDGFDRALLAALLQMRNHQPLAPSAGSVFKNPPGDFAGRMIEAVGLKGFRHGKMAWSDRHANFLVNLGGGSYDEAVWLIQEAKRRVYETFGQPLTLEIKILDRHHPLAP